MFCKIFPAVCLIVGGKNFYDKLWMFFLVNCLTTRACMLVWIPLKPSLTVRKADVLYSVSRTVLVEPHNMLYCIFRFKMTDISDRRWVPSQAVFGEQNFKNYKIFYNSRQTSALKLSEAPKYLMPIWNWDMYAVVVWEKGIFIVRRWISGLWYVRIIIFLAIMMYKVLHRKRDWLVDDRMKSISSVEVMIVVERILAALFVPYLL